MLTIRCYYPSDAVELLELFRRTIRSIDVVDYDPMQIVAWASDDMDVNPWRERFSGRFAYVGMTDGRTVGFIDMATNGHLDRLFVSAEHQRQGIGRALLARLRSDASEAGIARMFTDASITAKPFFEAAGFTVVREQSVECRGVELINYRMARAVDKPCVAPKPRSRVV